MNNYINITVEFKFLMEDWFKLSEYIVVRKLDNSEERLNRIFMSFKWQECRIKGDLRGIPERIK